VRDRETETEDRDRDRGRNTERQRETNRDCKKKIRPSTTPVVYHDLRGSRNHYVQYILYILCYCIWQ